MKRTKTSVGLTVLCGGMIAAALLFATAQTAKAQPSGHAWIANQVAQSQDAAVQSTPAAAPKLAGTWKLNEQQSDDPRAKMREAMGGGGQQGDSGAANPGRTGRRAGRGPGGRGGMMAQFSQLTIDQTDKATKVTGASGRLIATTEPPGKEDQNAEDNNGGMMRMPPAEAKWQGNQLVATSQGFGGGTVTRTFELSPDGKQLYMTTKIENERFSQPVTYRLVYDPGKAENNNQ